ncbi:putative OB-fold protein [Paenibacillus phyllosphaerae]|uniref:Putative OB-fold protein n=1 Tax=Paenibacillus phyllosphaerae TaxID=274593 RepID=A0A7W5B260_9BACL|nr:OB-fold domain-containing protein [Paenibacillus phyllosphaerae]MBB3112779.1 putative OB-fold protein [Paenibacillus phyllosphaerae]
MEMTLYDCEQCQTRSVPPRYVCPKCAGSGLTAIQADGAGTIYSCTTIYVAPERLAAEAPYAIILVDLDEGPRVTARLAQGIPKIGQRVVFNRYEDGVYWFE